MTAEGILAAQKTRSSGPVVMTKVSPHHPMGGGTLQGSIVLVLWHPKILSMTERVAATHQSDQQGTRSQEYILVSTATRSKWALIWTARLLSIGLMTNADLKLHKLLLVQS